MVNLPGGSTVMYPNSLSTAPATSPILGWFVLMPWQPWKIDFVYSVNDDGVTVDGYTTKNNSATIKDDYKEFTITTQDGVRYLFGLPTLSRFKPPEGVYEDYVSTWRLLAILGPTYSGPTDYESIGDFEPWKLNSISQGGWIKIEYEYETGDDVYTRVHGPGNSQLTQLTYPKYIKTSTHKAKFITSIRQDADLEIDNQDLFIHRRLDRIKLYRNDSSTAIKTIEFEYAVGDDRLIEKTTLLGITEWNEGQTQSIPGHRFEYYDNGEFWDIYRNDPSFYYRDDFGFLKGIDNSKFWSLSKIIYPTGGYDEFDYENDDFLDNSYQTIECNNSECNTMDIIFIDQQQGGGRVSQIRRSDGHSNTLEIDYSFGSGHISGIPEIKWRKQLPFCSSGMRGQNSVFYDWIEKSYPDGSSIKTHYLIGESREIVYDKSTSGAFSLVAEGIQDWAWGKLDSVIYYSAGNSLAVKKEIYDYTIRPEGDSSTPIARAITPANNPSYPVVTIDLAYSTLDRIDSYQYESGHSIHRQKSLTYNNSLILTAESIIDDNGVPRRSETVYAKDKYPAMRERNMRAQVAQKTIFENSHVFSSTATTWRAEAVEDEFIYVPAAIYRWHSDQAGGLPGFDFANPAETSGWELHVSFDSYDSHGNLTEFIDGENKTTRYEYSDNGVYLEEIERVQSPGDNLITHYQYDERWGAVSARIDENSVTTNYSYDDFGRLESLAHSGSQLSDYDYYYSRDVDVEYDDNNPNAITSAQYPGDGSEYITASYYDGLARLVQTRVREGANDLISAINYDLLGREQKIWKPYRRPDSDHTYDGQYVANANAWYNGESGPNGNGHPYAQIDYLPDPLNRTSAITPPGGGSTVSYNYNHADLDGALHRSVLTTDETGKTSRDYIDAFGDRVRQAARQAAADPVEFTETIYDDLHRVTDVGVVSGIAWPPGLDEDYADSAVWKERYDYDVSFLSGPYPKARLTRVRINMDNDPDADYERLLRYDSFGNVAYEQLEFYDDDQTIANTLDYDYDNLSNLLRLTYTSAAGEFVLNYEYDHAGRLARVLGGLGVVDTIKTFAYTPAGQVKHSRLAQGLETLDYLYTIRDWLDEFNTGSNVFSLDPEYEANGNVSSMAWTSNGFSANYTFGYDHLNRLLTADAGDNADIDPLGDVGYKYDQRGNILSLNRGTIDINTETHVYLPGTNRLDYAFDQSPGNYQYDPSGNVTADASRGLSSLTYDYHNLPVHIDRADGSEIEYGYAGSDRIYKKRGSTEHWYVRAASGKILAEINPNADGQRLNFEFTTTGDAQLEIEHDGQTETFAGSGSTEIGPDALIRLRPSTATGVVRLTALSMIDIPPVAYINLLAGGVMGQKRFEGDGDKDYFYLKDHLGSNRLILRDDDGIGVVAAVNDYYPFGKILRTGGLVGGVNKLKFIGKERDSESGLDYFGARYYDSNVGRWFGVDPFASRYAGWSPYNYGLNNPIRLVDPQGEDVWDSITGYSVGLVTGVKETVVGLYTTVRHPIETGKGFVHVVSHPSETYEALKAGVEQKTSELTSGDDYRTGKAVGEITAFVGEALAGTKGLGKISKTNRLTKTIKQVRKGGSRDCDILSGCDD